MADCVAKPDDKPLARNIRIIPHNILNQHCALASALESILLVLTSKIVLQQNRPRGDISLSDFLARLLGKFTAALDEDLRQGADGAVLQDDDANRRVAK